MAFWDRNVFGPFKKRAPGVPVHEGLDMYVLCWFVCFLPVIVSLYEERAEHLTCSKETIFYRFLSTQEKDFHQLFGQYGVIVQSSRFLLWEKKFLKRDVFVNK